MSDLISGKEALIALANGEEVETKKKDEITWSSIGFFAVNIFKDEKWDFRLKPRTVYLNGIEVPTPFEPKEGIDGYIIDLVVSPVIWDESDPETYRVGVWRNEDEIEQVVVALRSVFNVK